MSGTGYVGMLANAILVVTRWDGPLMVGFSRSLSDFAYATYLSDLAVRESHQRLGIGKEMIRMTQKLGGPKTRVILLAAPPRWNTTRGSGSRHTHPAGQSWVIRN